jgi:CBS domain-containing protein
MSFARPAVEDDMKIAQLMTKDVRTCRHSDMLDAVVRSMWDCDIGSLPVIDDSGQLVGMVTDRDACMAAFLQRQPLHDIAVAGAMTKHPVACTTDDNDRDVAALMAKHKVRRIPVVDDAQRPIGVVSLNDLACAMARGREIPSNQVASTLAAICEHRA